MATKDARIARRALGVQLTATVIITLTLGLVGVALLGYFQSHPEELPPSIELKGDADRIFPMYIARYLPVGISGLVLAAMFAAAMSSLDSGVNSITAVVTIDILERFGFRSKNDKNHVRWIRVLAFLIGAIVVVGSAFVAQVPGNITAVTQKVSNLVTTPLFCLFFFALYVPIATPAGVMVGTILGFFTAVVIGFSGPLFGMHPKTGLDPISFQWIAPASITVNVITGILASIIFNKINKKQTYRAR